MTAPWYKNAVFYAVDVGTFQDSDGNGLGDFHGLIQRLDYLQDVGFTGLWLLPFYPSPHRDNGYDITEYTNVATRLGTLDDFRQLVDEAHRREIRVLADLVAHHTSLDHPWFQAARTNRESRYRDYYIWSDTIPEGEQPESIFPGVEESVWTYDELAQAYYFHRFYHFEPDLNFANPHVQQEMLDVAELWLSFGSDGFRLDAANHLFERKGLPGTEAGDPCAYLEKLHDLARQYNPEAVLLAEADIPPDQFEQFACQGNGIQLFFNFPVNNHLYLALARENATPLTQSLSETPLIPEDWSWVNFLRNLDELDLERLTDSEREEVYRAFGPDENMEIYGRGIRRRLAPMLAGDARQLKMVFSLLLSLPGSAMIPYGDEIGMGDDLSLPERDSVRTPMQWSDQPYGGFSTSPHHPEIAPVIDSGAFGYQRVNVEAQQRDKRSLMHFIRSAIAQRRELPCFTEQRAHLLQQPNGHVFSLCYEHPQGTLLTLHNFSSQPQRVPLDEPAISVERPVLADDHTTVDFDGTPCLSPYGYGWFQVREESGRDAPER